MKTIDALRLRIAELNIGENDHQNLATLINELKQELNHVPTLPAVPTGLIPEIKTGDYDSLDDVLTRAFDQASKGKGKERHAQSLPFENQPMQQISNLVGSPDGMVYQLMKKAQESLRLPTTERKVAELLGTIVYTAGVIIYLENKNG